MNERTTPRTDALIRRHSVGPANSSLTVAMEEHARQLERELAAAQEALAAKNAALDFAEGAIEDAIYSEDGLEGDTGQRVIAIIQEARDKGTFDKEQFGDPPKTRIELEADLAAAQEAHRLALECANMWAAKIDKAQEARQAAEALAAQNAKDAERYRKARANGGFFFSSDRMTDGEIDARIDELPDYAADISSGELAAAIAGEPK